MAKAIYISATEKNAGKTSISIGLIKYLTEKGMRVGFMKPLAQRYVEVIGEETNVTLISSEEGLEEESLPYCIV